MSDTLTRKAFEKRLALMSPPLATAYENVKYVPVNGTPYQKVNLLPGQPENPTLGDDYYREIGVFQITLRYPIETGPAAAEERAEAVIQHFKRSTSMTESGQTVQVIRTPAKAPAFIDVDRYCIPISIYYRTEIF
ncbi:MAG TPA: DUF4128 domain-containing protein [Methylophilaceae bacterium]|nr:DUF4128 domain-containing protein [Methylophilaceae bacterium]